MRVRIAVGMSGGVDSSVTAGLLVEQGYQVIGVYIEAYREMGCRADKDRQDALKVASKLGIEFRVLDYKQEYRRRVIDYFYNEYRAGRTPNPDIVCNREVKFGLFWDWAMQQGFEKVATGHYAQVDKEGRLRMAEDKNKDQSYFLWQVDKEKLKRVMFPLGKMKKNEVRRIAKQMGLVNWDKPDSMGVCMMGDLDLAGKLREELGEQVGEVVMKGKVVGKHNGLWFATIGQRVGAEIYLQGQSLKLLGIDMRNKPALYVVGKDLKNKRIIIGERKEGYVSELRIKNYELRIARKQIQNKIKDGKLWVRVRNLGKLHKITELDWINGAVSMGVREKIWGVASGQSGVLYDDEGWIVGGGVII